MTKSHIGRKIRKTAKRMLKCSRVAGRALGKGTGFARKIIGTADKFSGGMASKMLLSNPYTGTAYRRLIAADTAAKVMTNPRTSLQKELVKTGKDISGLTSLGF